MTALKLLDQLLSISIRLTEQTCTPEHLSDFLEMAADSPESVVVAPKLAELARTCVKSMVDQMYPISEIRRVYELAVLFAEGMPVQTQVPTEVPTEAAAEPQKEPEDKGPAVFSFRIDSNLTREKIENFINQTRKIGEVVEDVLGKFEAFATESPAESPAESQSQEFSDGEYSDEEVNPEEPAANPAEPVDDPSQPTENPTETSPNTLLETLLKTSFESLNKGELPKIKLDDVLKLVHRDGPGSGDFFSQILKELEKF